MLLLGLLTRRCCRRARHQPTLIMVPVVVHFRRLDGVRRAMNKDKLARLQAQVRTGGKGSVRRKKKAVHKTTTTGECSPAPGRSRAS